MVSGKLGVPALDARLGPVPAGGSVLLRQGAGVESLPFLLQATTSHVEHGQTVVFVVTQRTPERIRKALQLHGADLEAGHLLFVDAHSARIGARDGEATHIQRPEDIKAVLAALDEVAVAHPNSLLVVDAFDMLLADHPGGHGLNEALRHTMARFGAVLAAATEWNIEGDHVTWTSAFDAEVALRAVEERIVLNQMMEIRRSPWAETVPAPVLYKIATPGGVLAHVPKLVVIGPHDAGKTTFVHAVAGEATSVERMGTTVALDRATVHLGSVAVEVFGTPGQARFDALLPTLTRQASAAVLVVDATRPDLFPRAAEILAMVWRSGLTAVVALNKQDLEGAITPEEVGDRLKLPAGVPMIGCSATDSASARFVLREALHRLLGVQV